MSSITSSVCSGRVHFTKKTLALSRAPTNPCKVASEQRAANPFPCSTIPATCNRDRRSVVFSRP